MITATQQAPAPLSGQTTLPVTEFADSGKAAPQIAYNSASVDTVDRLDAEGGTWTLKGTLEVGRFVANKWLSAIRESAWNLDLKLDLTELGSTWTTKTFGYYLEGSKENIEIFQRWLQRAMDEFNSY